MRAFIFDTETTGLFKFFHKAHTKPEQMKPYPWTIELFGHTVTDDGTVHGEVEFFAKPGVKLEPIITKITGLTDEILVDEAKFEANADRVLERLADSEAIVAHNLSYDLRMLEVDFKRIGRWDECEAAIAKLRKICTIEQSEHYFGYRLNLTKLHEYLFKETFEGAHRARSDVNALTRCYLEMRRRGDI